jgi:hypothetical protein
VTENTLEELERQIHEINAEESSYHDETKARKKAIADEIARQTTAARLAQIADTLSDADKEALKVFLSSEE